MVILSTSTSTEIPNHKTKGKKTTEANNTEQAIRQGNLRKIAKCLLTLFS